MGKERIKELREYAEEFSFDHMIVGVSKRELLDLLALAEKAVRVGAAVDAYRQEWNGDGDRPQSPPAALMRYMAKIESAIRGL